MIPHRSFLTVFLLSVVTCGIYWYYYMYRLTQDINQNDRRRRVLYRRGGRGAALDHHLRAVQLVLALPAGRASEKAGRLQRRLLRRDGDDLSHLGDHRELGLRAWQPCGPYLLIKNFNNIADAYNAHFYFS